MIEEDKRCYRWTLPGSAQPGQMCYTTWVKKDIILTFTCQVRPGEVRESTEITMTRRKRLGRGWEKGARTVEVR